MSKLCPNCGKVVEDNLTKCSSCGTDLPIEQKEEAPVEEIVEFNPIPVIQFNEEKEIDSNDSSSVVDIPVVNETIEKPNVEDTTIESVDSVEKVEDNVVETVEEVKEVIEDKVQPEPGSLASAIAEVPVVTETVETKNDVVEAITQPLPEEEKPQLEVNALESAINEVPLVDVAKEEPKDVVEETPVVAEVTETVTEVTEEVTEPVEEVKEVVEDIQPEVETLETTIEETPVVAEVTEPVSEVTEEIKESVEEVKEVVEDIQPEVETLETTIEETPVVAEVTESASEVTEEVTEPVEEVQETVEPGKIKPVIDANTVIDVPEGIQEISVDDIVNNELESVSVQVEAEKDNAEEVIEKVELPEATVGEIDSTILTSMYEQEEKQNENNKKLLAKEEEERQKREEEARIAKQKMEPKPDLMARVDYVVSNDPNNQPEIRKKKKSSFLPKFFIILIIMLAGAGAYWYFFARDSKPKEETYETTIKNYYRYIEKKDKTGILSTYVPCTRKDENVLNELEVALSSFKDNYKIEYKINNVEVVNEDDQNNLKTATIGTYCGTDNIPNITDYKHVYVSQTIVSDERTTNDMEFWVVKIDNKWYIVPITENL